MEAVSLVRLALQIITDRLLVIVALGLSFSLACWTMYIPTWERLGTLSFFCVFSYALLTIKDKKYDRKETSE
jgi:hypothetical protein